MQEMSNKETNTYSSREQRACVYACIPPPGGWLSEIKAKSGICCVALSNNGLQIRTVFRGVFNVMFFSLKRPQIVCALFQQHKDLYA